MKVNNVCAIVVTYEPICDTLLKLLDSLVKQVAKVLVIDNGSCGDLYFIDELHKLDDIELVQLDSNKGIGYAHNYGIEYAQKHGYEFALLMDQDSLPADDMVDVLIHALEVTGGCAVGPQYYDERRDNQSPFAYIHGFRLRYYPCDGPESIVPVDHLISSGCLFPVWAFSAIGLMREDFFIDNVDVEWGLRARYLGYQLYGVCGAVMSHSLGDTPLRVWCRDFVVHGHQRHYYQFRNTMILMRERWVPFSWKIVYGWRLCIKFVFYFVFADDHLLQLKSMALGLLHGVKGKTGPITLSEL